MTYFEAGWDLKFGLLCCVIGSATAVAALLFNHPATLLVFYFIGLPILAVGMVICWKADWQEILNPRKTHSNGK